MVKFLLFTFLILCITGVGIISGQNSFAIEDTNHVSVEDDTVYVTGDANAFEIVEEFIVTNTSSSTLTVKVKEEEIYLADTSQVTFCWVLCYSPTVQVSNFSLTMAPGYSTSGAENLSSHYYPYGSTGISMVRYTVYDVNNPVDSAVVTVVFQGQSTSVENTMISDVFLNAPYPNPANTHTTFKYNFKKSNAVLHLYDIVGNEIGKYQLQGNRFDLNTANLHSGTYFYSVVVDGKKYKTQRLLVTH